jgi:hypothetical protein
MVSALRVRARFAMTGLLAAGVTVGLATQPAPAASVAKARELAALMKAKRLEAFAVRDGAGPDRFVAAMQVPDVQMLVVSATYSRPTDIEYYLYQKDYLSAYRALQAGTLAGDRFFVEDVLGDGLVAVPAKNALPDAVTVGTARQVLDGPADPRKRNDTRLVADAYGKAFASADQRYEKMLDGLIAELKKVGILASGAVVR